jgi:hypothetical protein
VDNDLEFLKETLGPDLSYYGQWAVSAARKPWVIYTAIAGGYDSLREPLHDNPLFDHIVFSDEPVKSVRWRWVPFDESMAEPVRTAKKPKILPHVVMPQYEWSIWVDANIFISGELTDYISSCINANCTVGMFLHPERETALQEAGVCMESGRDNIPTITAQMDRYKTDGFDFGTPLYEGNFIVRRHNDPGCVALMNRWWREVETGSRRDQLALPYAAWRTGTAVHSLAPKGVSVRTVGNLYYSQHGEVTADQYLERIAQHSTRYRKYGSAA